LSISHDTTQYLAQVWPKLFKTTSKGGEQEWTIAVQDCGDNTADIITVHGKVGGKMQEARVHVAQGKNLGKKNATTALQQALAEAEAKHKKQLDKGYAAERGGSSMELKPMLAHKYEDDKDKVVFSPAFIQPKLDGIRCLAHRVSEYDIRLISRQGKSLNHDGLNHILMVLRTYMRDGDVWDGELYVHGVSFQSIASWTKKAQDDSQKLQYHVYDLVLPKPFEERYDLLCDRLLANDVPVHLWEDQDEVHRPPVRLVPTQVISSHEDVQSHHEVLVAKGYEGVMLRWGEEPYKSGYRSHSLLKVKAFQDQEFDIIDVVQGKGKFEGRAIFVCRTNKGDTFEAVPKGRDELRQRYFTEREKLIGKMLSVRFFEWTAGDNPVPRFPIAISVRDYE
jgi:ATP-dependent DNA ligase